jgi:hypothetical protein
MIPTWNEDLDGYYPQMPFTNEFLGKPLDGHPLASGQMIRWDGSSWKATSANAIVGPTIKVAYKTEDSQALNNSKTPVKLTGMSITIATEAGDVLQLGGVINLGITTACTPWFCYTVDNGTKVCIACHTNSSGYAVANPIRATITDLAPGTHTIDIWGASDQNTTCIEIYNSSTRKYYTYVTPASHLVVKRYKAQT